MSHVDLEHIKQAYIESDLLFSQAEVEAAINRMAHSITEQMQDANPVVFSVMNGGLVIAGQLLTRLNFPLEASYLHATRYRNTTSGHELEWKVPPMVDFKGRPVLIIDDILDEGHTLAAIIDYCRDAGAADVQCAVLVNKLHDRKARPNLKAEFVGLEVEDRYIFGYGMDYQGYWRNAPGIFAIKGK
ncbi:Hypoxanthine-guanine phosphoribosyltransferase [Marinobacterium lacunae]|uniref:Hypoxanthine-guanine phosphoribosyltransferase n=1 Tax=Marinobacterium lacunae TaxID=1232683 RepID=A0A081G432_9GAMM|nr:hypoxanthine-guanine phosphoribosyltransferase [Marinobacterium lacunae]KEA65537.1 Hypoxanthine-guanine phosphoribosyltransferase [Marinobacterium lacunae]MBR9883094.1 hypoxanthine-guanine phosphoribosyltransferase [Oceanospirillales bacterium]